MPDGTDRAAAEQIREIPRHLPAGDKTLYGDAMMSLPVIAIDGNAASGKGALARSLAGRLGFAHMDTGVLYRLVALRMLENGCDASDEQSAVKFARMIRRTFDHRNVTAVALKTDDVSLMTSQTSAFPMVRAEVLEVQREFVKNPPDLPGGEAAKGSVLDGRDIGTVVCPDAPVKFFVTADAETRAFRRFREMRLSGFRGTYEAVLAEMFDRDARDAARATAPMKRAADAVILDTTTLQAFEVVEAALFHVRGKLGVAGE
jgi:cytidylate kinase